MPVSTTPMMTPSPVKKEAKEEAVPKDARKRRKSAVYDHEGNEVLITMMCLKCKAMKPLTMFGLRKMADGAIRNQPWCRTCRSGASSARKKEQREHAADEALVHAHDVEEFDDFHRDWPNILVSDQKTIERVDAIWDKLGLGKFIKSPSLKYAQQLYKGGAVAEEG